MLKKGDVGGFLITDRHRQSLMPAIMALIAWGKEHFNEVVTD